MKTLLFTLLLSTPLLASTYRCGVQGNDDYAVEINLHSGKAAFFDNDNWSKVWFVRSNLSKPIFRGKDNYDQELVITFDRTSASNSAGNFGTVEFFEDGRMKTRRIVDCRYDRELSSVI
jgi:hypothetical protein